MSQAAVASVVAARVDFGRNRVLGEINLTVERGEVVAVVGANGSGKSTLLRVIVGLIRPQRGEVRLFGQPPHSAAVLHRVGAMIDAPALYPWMSGRAVLRTLLDLGGDPDRGRTSSALARFGLAGAARQPVIRYSQGMRKRLALAAASLRQPELLVLDEPTNALDEESRADVLRWISGQRAAGGAAIIVSHRPDDAQISDRILRLSSGQLQPTTASEWPSAG